MQKIRKNLRDIPEKNPELTDGQTEADRPIEKQQWNKISLQ